METKLSLEIVDDEREAVKLAKNEAVRKVLEMIGQQAENYAKDNITAGGPRKADSWDVPTGRLRNSVTHATKDGEVYIGSNLEYAIYNEVGTGVYLDPEMGQGRKGGWWYVDDIKGELHHTMGMTPLHFLKNALADHQDEYKKMIEDVLKSSD